MNRRLRGRISLAVLGAALGPFSAGCLEEPKGAPKLYIPSPEAARAGVTQAMEAWIKGLPPDALDGATRKIHVIDPIRRADQRLAGYEILGEKPTGNAREFTVRLSHDGSDEPQTVRYYAVGVEPMWIFREEAYHKVE